MASLFIEGAWVTAASGATAQGGDPSDGAVAGEVEVADEADVERAEAAVRGSFRGVLPARAPSRCGARPRLVAGGSRPTDPALAGGFYLRPTVLADVDREMSIIREEVFGPVLTVERFTTEDGAILLGNDTRCGPAGPVWTRDNAPAQRVARRLRHGTTWINEYNRYLPRAEWGGFKPSGIGRGPGPDGLAAFQEAEQIHGNAAPAPTGWFGDAS